MAQVVTPGDRAAHGVEGAQRGVDRVRGERLLGALHGHDLGVPRIGKIPVEELEPGERLHVGELKVGDVGQAEQRAPGPPAEGRIEPGCRGWPWPEPSW